MFLALTYKGDDQTSYTPVLPKTKMIAKKFDFYCDFCGDFFLEILECPPSTYKGYADSCKNCLANSGHLSLDVLLLIFPVNEI